MKKAKNVIWVFGDQHRAQAMSHIGDVNLQTPYLDGMAETGVSFSNAVSGCPWCAPFRAALLTGQYIHKTVQRTPQALDSKIPNVADAFNAAGYRTAYFGKWHLDGSNKSHFIPRERRGRFDTWVGYENRNAHYECAVHGHDEHGRDDKEADVQKFDGYETDVLTDLALDYLQEEHEQPFFMVLSVTPPHDPYYAPPEYEKNHSAQSLKLRPNVPPVARVEEKARQELAGYYAQIENLDYNVGRIFDTLAKTGLDDNTHVFFFSDHGDMHGSHGYFRKSSPWEEAVRIPFIVRSPGKRTIPAVCPAPMNHVDIAPTTLGLCDIEIPPSMMGTDFSHHLDPQKPAPDSEPQSAFLQHAFRKRFHCLNRVWRGIRTVDGWKYVCLEGQPFAMFNLNEDPYEMANLAFLDTFNDKRAELQEELQQWIEKTGDSFALPEL